MKLSIQGELGSNSHMAALSLLPQAAIVPSTLSIDALDRVLSGEVEGCVLPIENSLHGSVLEHYDLLLARPLSMVRELNLPIRHNLIAAPGVSLADLRRALSHPVALSQCRRWLAAHPNLDAVSFYDTAGAVKHILEHRLTDAAAIAPVLAAEVYGGTVLLPNLEDHAENYTRFHLIVPRSERSRWIADQTASAFGTRQSLTVTNSSPHPQTPQTQTPDIAGSPEREPLSPNKMSIAFAVEHRPGTLVAALELLHRAGADLTKIESRPVPGRAWEYIFYVDLRFNHPAIAARALDALASCCGMVIELGRYPAAGI